MTTRSRIITTAALLCHLLLAAPLVTSQTPPLADGGNPMPSAAGSQVEEEATIRAVEQEKTGVIYHLRGKAEIDYRSYILRADEITYNSDTGASDLQGHVVLDGGP